MYAISLNALGFIKKILSYNTVVPFLDSRLLFTYAQQCDKESQQFIFEVLANNSEVQYGSFLSIFGDIASAFFSKRCYYLPHRLLSIPGCSFEIDYTKLNQDYSYLMEIVLLSGRINHNEEFFLDSWIRSFSIEMANTDNSDAVSKTFFKYLPKKQELRHFILVKLIKSFLPDTLKIGMLNQFIELYSVNSDEIITALHTPYISFSPSDYQVLKALLEHIETDHNYFSNFYLITKFLDSPPDERANVIKDFQLFLFDNIVPENVQSLLINMLDVSVKEILIEHYINNPKLTYGKLLSSSLFQCCKESVIISYLKNYDLESPGSLLRLLHYQEKFKLISHLVSLLTTRPDYSFHKHDLFQSLMILLDSADNQSLGILLNNSEALQLLKNYLKVRGDGEFSIEQRGMLLPKVIAWCVKNAGDKAEELFLSFSSEERKELLKGCVPSFIDSSEPTLRAYIIKSARPKLIEAIGGIYPRLFNTNSLTVYLPTSLLHPNNAGKIKSIQKSFVVEFFAKKHSQKLSIDIEKDSEVKSQAKLAVNNCKRIPLKLQHQTFAKNLEEILMKNRLKSHRHISGHMTDGKVSRGLDRPNDDSKSDFCCFTRRSTGIFQNGMTIHFSALPQEQNACFVFNGRQLFEECQHLSFIIVGTYQYFEPRQISLPSGDTLALNTSSFRENADMRMIDLRAEDKLSAINQILFEMVIKKVINPLPEHLKSELIERITAPETEADYKL